MSLLLDRKGLISRYRKDLLTIALLALLAGLFFAPAILGIRGIFHDDLAMDEFPRMYFYARHLQRGVIPLFWPEIWCGARSLVSYFNSNLYYPPLWPFLLLADLANLETAYFWINLVPLFLHYFIASLGMYLLARRALGLNRPGSFLAAVLYFLSPALAFSYAWVAYITFGAWLPWFLLLYIGNVNKPGVLIFCGGGMLFSFMIFSSAMPYVAYTLLLASVICAALMIKRCLGTGSYPVWRPLGVLAGYILIGVILSTVYWLPAYRGISAVEESGILTYEFAAGGEGSLHPLYLITLLVPGLFGGLNGTHLWGLGQVRFWEANMAGGLAVTLLVLLGFLLPWTLPKEEKWTRVFRLVAAAGGTIYLCSLLIMLGRHTPFYRLLWDYLPLVGRFPYPIRYRLLQCTAAAVLGGLGLHLLFDPRTALKTISRRRIVRYYLIMTPVLVAGILFWPPAKVMEVVEKGDLAWFISSPILYLALGIGLIALISRSASPRRFAYLLAILAVLDIGYSAFHAVYLGTFHMGGETYPQHRRARGPGDHPMYQRALRVLPAYLGDTDLRITSDQPFHDNLQQLGPYDSFMGYDMKPLEPRFRKAAEEAFGRELEWNFLYGLHRRYPRARHPAFYGNMSVGFFLSALSDNPFPRGATVRIETDPDYYLHYNHEALPRAFTLDRLVESTEEEAKRELVRGDLRKGVFVENSYRLSVIGGQDGRADFRSLITDYRSFNPGPREEYLAYFEELQAANPITRLDFSHPNRVEVDLSVTKPALLALTEVWYPGWEVRVDGEPAELLRVNYLQRGVRLGEGEKRVEMVFRPRPWRIGAAVSLVSWSLLVLTVLGAGRKKLADRRRGALNRTITME